MPDQTRTEQPSTTQDEYQSVVICNDDPCRYCRAAGTEYVMEKTFTTSDAALAHAKTMARNVYGASTHQVAVDARPVGPRRRAISATPA